MENRLHQLQHLDLRLLIRPTDVCMSKGESQPLWSHCTIEGMGQIWLFAVRCWGRLVCLASGWLKEASEWISMNT